MKCKRILSFIVENFTMCGCLFSTPIFLFLPWRSTSLRILYRRAERLLFNEEGSQQGFESLSHSHLLVTWGWGYQLQRPASSLHLSKLQGESESIPLSLVNIKTMRFLHFPSHIYTGWKQMMALLSQIEIKVLCMISDVISLHFFLLTFLHIAVFL